jgi:UDP-N-acetylglucosamine 4,6-dehydratase/5-epimerase
MEIKIKTQLKKELKNKVILITGGAGSIGSELAETILQYPVKSLRILDIDEHALFKFSRKNKDKRIRILLGSVLNRERIDMACSNVDIIIHTAAIKNIEISEFNAIETIDININGTVNMIKSAERNKPKKFLNISTDKAAESSTLYGTTKQVGERLTSWASSHIDSTKFSSVRFGNVIETRGNVFEVWDEERQNNKPLSITDPKMRRYFFHKSEAVDFVLETLTLMKGGEVFVPKMESFKINDLANKISKKHKIIGKRRGEKLKEVLLTDNELKNSKELKNMWILKPYMFMNK